MLRLQPGVLCDSANCTLTVLLRQPHTLNGRSSMLVREYKPFGHPSTEVVERLIDRLGEDNAYHTDKDRTIKFITDGERLWVRVEKSENSLTAERPGNIHSQG